MVQIMYNIKIMEITIMKTMKKTNTIILIASMLIASLMPVAAETNGWKSSSPMLPRTYQTSKWQTSSSMQATGSKFKSHIIEAYAPEAQLGFIPMYSTSTMREVEAITTPEWDIEGSSNHKGGIRRGFDTGAESGQSEEFPIGEPWALLLFAAAFAGVEARRQHLRTQKAAEE